MVDDTELPIHSTSFMAPTPDSILFSLGASINIPAPFPIRLAPTTLSLFMPNIQNTVVPLINVKLPETELHGNTSLTITNQTAQILDHGQFLSFVTNALHSKTFTLGATGFTDAFLGVLKAHININKAMTLDGMCSISDYNSRNRI